MFRIRISFHADPDTDSGYYKRILAFMLPVMYSPNEPDYFLGYFPFRIRIQEAHFHSDPCGSGSETLILGQCMILTVLRIRIYYYADPDPGSKKCPYGSGS